MKRTIKASLADYIVRDPELAPTLHKFRSSGKRLFLLTNSAWDYTDAVMTHLLGTALPYQLAAMRLSRLAFRLATSYVRSLKASTVT